MKLQPRKVKKEDKVKYLDSLYSIITSLKSREEIENFLKHLLTESEQIMIGRRLLIAKGLLEDKSYDEIIDELHVGADTITRIHRWLAQMPDNHEKSIKNLEKKLYSKKPKSEGSYPEPLSFAWLKKKYPLHFLLFNLIDMVKKD